MYQAAFLFDMDGVIVDSNPYHKIALKNFCEKHGHHLSEEKLREKIYGRTNRDWITNLFGNIDESLMQSYANEKESLFRSIYKEHIRPLRGLEAFLKQLDLHSIKRAIGTSAPKANVDFTLQHTGLGAYFNTILDESFVTHGKPDPEIYLKCASALELDPKQCIVIEDSLSGVEAGKAAGCKVIGITTTHSPEELYKSDLILADFEGIKPIELIQKIF